MNALLIDIGNSRIKVRVADLGHDPESRDAASGWLGPPLVVDTADAAQIVDRFAGVEAAVDAVCISNVASTPCGEGVARAAVARWPHASIRHVVAERERCGVVNGYRQPERLGADRWLALVGARYLEPRHSLLVCSFGTATTIDLLVASTPGAKARFVGGLILPGFEAMRRGLSAATARLPLAEGHARDFADSTDDAMASGVFAAQTGAVAQSIRCARARLANSAEAVSLRCLLTGGNAATIAHAMKDAGVGVAVVPDLVLAGLRRWAQDTFAEKTALRPSRLVTAS